MSSWLGGFLHHLVMNFLLEHKLGWVFPQETGMRIWADHPNRVRKPDLAFVRRGDFLADGPKRAG